MSKIQIKRSSGSFKASTSNSKLAAGELFYDLSEHELYCGEGSGDGTAIKSLQTSKKQFLNKSAVQDTINNWGGGISPNTPHDSLRAALLDMVYPVGSIYMSVNNISPQLFLGGTWERWGAGRVPISVGSNNGHVFSENIYIYISSISYNVSNNSLLPQPTDITKWNKIDFSDYKLLENAPNTLGFSGDCFYYYDESRAIERYFVAISNFSTNTISSDMINNVKTSNLYEYNGLYFREINLYCPIWTSEITVLSQFDMYKYGPEGIGGEYEHTLTIDEMPKHCHQNNEYNSEINSNSTDFSDYTEYTISEGVSNPYSGRPASGRPCYGHCNIFKNRKKNSIC